MSKGSQIRPRQVTREQWSRFWDDIFTGMSTIQTEDATDEITEGDTIRHRPELRPPVDEGGGE